MNLNFTKSMKVNPIFSVIMLFILGSIIFYSCNEDATPAEFEAQPDIFVQKKKVNNETLYAPYYYVYSNRVLTSAVATTPASATINLTILPGSSTTFAKIPEEGDFTTNIVPSGEYSFNITPTEGEAIQKTDALSGTTIDIPVIDSAGYNIVGDFLYVSWQLIPGADSYNVKLFTQSGELAFNGPALSDDSEEYAFNVTTQGWNKTPYSGDMFVLQVNAYSFDAEATTENWFYNLECNTITDTIVEWAP